MKSTGMNRTKAAYPIDTSDEITTTPYNVSSPTETYNVTIADGYGIKKWDNVFLRRKPELELSDDEAMPSPVPRVGRQPATCPAIFSSPRDPCDNFYEFTCADWHATSSDLQQYDNADDAVTGFVEEMARTVLDGGRPAELKPLFNIWNACKHTGVVTDSDLRSALASLGLNVSKAASVTASDVLHAAGNLLYKLDNAPILSMELVSNPWNATPKLIAVGVFALRILLRAHFRVLNDSFPWESVITHVFEHRSTSADLISYHSKFVSNDQLGEPDIFVSSVDVLVEASKKQLSALAYKFFNAWACLGERNDTLCEAVADIAFALAKLSRLDQHVSEQMNLHWVASHAYIRMFIPFLSVMKGAEDYISEDATYVVKNILQVGALRDLLTSKPSLLMRPLGMARREVLAYMAFHTTVYLAPFLQGKEDLWGFAMFMLTKTQRPQPVPKWRLCLRLAEVMIEEVRSSFIEEVMAIERLESWTKHMLTVKAQSIRVHTFFMAQYAINVFVNNTMAQIEEEIPWKKDSPFEYFLNVSAFMAKDWASPIRHPLIEQR
ncbi:hypothetical protein HPB51_000009 [Rhipicephalus microplus]|uniref:Peptidase M13 N-terminal domain-containing protein n=1 Tax=Rhipicephalus microplus TaxID=6941 RepID=A0A9J6D3H1_RHIMP|nr:hypothetical protein HPB51_000009 [Rhipicephalus microplus]